MNLKSTAFGVTVFALIAFPLLSSSRLCNGFDLSSALLYGLTALLLLLYTLSNPQTRHGGMLGAYIKGYFIWLLFSALIAPRPALAFWGTPPHNGGFFFFLASGFFFYIGNWLRDYKKQLLLAAVLTGALVGAMAALEFWAGLWTDFQRSGATFGNPMLLAPYLILIVPGCLGGLLTTRNQGLQAAGLLSWFFLLVGTFVTFACGGWGGLVITALLFGLFAGQRFLKNRRTVIYALGISIAALGLSAMLIQVQSQSIGAHLLARNIKAEAIVASGPPPATVLNTNWRVFWERPWTGVGLNGLVGVGAKYRPATYHVKYPAGNSEPVWVRNDLAHTLATQGVLGLLVYLGLLFWVGKNWWTWMACERRELVDAGLWSALFGYFMIIQFSFPWVGYPFIGWLFIGLLNPEVSDRETVRLSVPLKLKVALASLCVIFALGYGIRSGWAALELAMNRGELWKPSRTSRLLKVQIKPRSLPVLRKDV